MASVLGLKLAVSFYSIVGIIIAFFVIIFILDWLFNGLGTYVESNNIVLKIIKKLDLINTIHWYLFSNESVYKDKFKGGCDCQRGGCNCKKSLDDISITSSLTYDPKDLLKHKMI